MKTKTSPGLTRRQTPELVFRGLALSGRLKVLVAQHVRLTTLMFAEQDQRSALLLPHAQRAMLAVEVLPVELR